MTQSKCMRCGLGIFPLFFAALLPVLAQTPALSADTSKSTDFAIDTEHPRIFLRPRRLRLLRRERERQSLRWMQFQTLMTGRAPMPEQGFASALYYQVSGDKDAGRRAITTVLGRSADPRQMAIVFDWCQDLLTPQESRDLAARLQKTIETVPVNSVEQARVVVLAAVALSGHSPAAPAALQKFQRYWDDAIVPQLRAGKDAIGRDQGLALFEILHAIRDNTNADLRESFPAYFKSLPIYHLLSYYPAPYPAAENEYHIPISARIADPDLTRAALSRAAELSMVAFDSNAPGTQVLQGWLMNDRYLLRGPFGIPYEFLWANPYQPGLSYYHVPLVFRDEIFGRLFVRSSWDDSANWAGFFDGVLQLFHDGEITALNPELSRDPIDLEEATIFFGKIARRFRIPLKESDDAFIVGLEPRHKYHVEIDDEEMTEVESDPGGILYFPGSRGGVTIRLKAE